MQTARQLVPQHSRGMQNRPYRFPAYQQDPQRRVKKVTAIALFLASFMLSLVVVAQYSSLVIANYQLSRAQRELAVVKNSVSQLELKVAKNSSIVVIEEIARTELGMGEPELKQIKVISAGRVFATGVGE